MSIDDGRKTEDTDVATEDGVSPVDGTTYNDTTYNGDTTYNVTSEDATSDDASESVA